jgi:hypothetical protein
MRSRSHRQLVLELDCEERRRPIVPRPDALMQALADLLLEALHEPRGPASTRGGVHEHEDHA